MQPLFTVPVADVEKREVNLSWTIPPDWLDAQLADSEAKSQGLDGELTAFLAKNGREILVQAKARVHIVMPCARTLDPVPMTIEPAIYLLLVPRESARQAQGPQRLGRAAHKDSGKKDPLKKAAVQGAPKKEKPNKKQQEEPDLELGDEDAARDSYSGEHIVLDGFLREHILLELPLFPLRSDLRSEDSPAIGPPSTAEPSEARVDPRLAPLAAIASKLRDKKE